MHDIFVSYAREDHDWASLFTQRLREVGGWDVWWDLKLLPGEQFDHAIESALDRARCVIVIWSQHSINSRWVRSEAREGAQRGLLVPVRIDSVTPPLEFRSFETADMSKWRGDAADADFTEIVHVVRHAIDRTPRQRAAAADTATGDVKLHTRATSRWIGGVAVAIALIMGIGLATRGGPSIDRPVALSFATMPTASTNEPAASTIVPAAHVIATPRRLPELSYGTWTLRNAVDADGGDWSNSTIKFTSQETTADGLALTGTMTWRLRELLIGTEGFAGRYVDTTRQIYLEGHNVSDTRLALGSYSAVLSADERSLLEGTWGSTAAPDQASGVPGRWEASR